MTQYVYMFNEGNRDMASLLGGKGANLAEMTNAGLPVPPGFTVTTEACNAFYANDRTPPEGVWDEMRASRTPGRASVVPARRCSCRSARVHPYRCPA